MAKIDKFDITEFNPETFYYVLSEFEKDKKVYDIEFPFRISDIILTNCKNDKIEIRDSKIHGKGLFAKEDIKKNSIITCYPIHALVLKSKKKQRTVFKNESEKFEINFNYALNVKKNVKYKGKKYHVIAIGNPKKINKTIFLGHMINDSSSFKIENENITLNELKTIIGKYCINSKNNCKIQCIFDSYFHCIVASKDIKRDEELFASYGFQYWSASAKIQKKFSELLEDQNFKIFISKYYNEDSSYLSTIKSLVDINSIWLI